MKKLSFEQMENVSGGNLTTLSACFQAMYDVNEAAGELANAVSAEDYLNASYKLFSAADRAQKSCGEL